MSINTAMLLHKFNSVLDQADLDYLSNAILSCSNLNDESGMDKFYKNSRGITNLEQTLKYVDTFTNLLITVYNKPFHFSNTYARIYSNSSFLGIHTDRPGLDITMSVCVGNTTNKNWPLCVSHKAWHGAWKDDTDTSAYKDVYSCINLNPGDAGVMQGIIYPHWRDQLECAEDQYALYVFYHWTTD
jgi:hypothetical protein